MNKCKMKSHRRPLILFSGGLDSTYTLMSTLSYTDVDILIVKSNRLHDVQQEAETIARTAILKHIEEFVQSGRLKHRVVTVHTYEFNVDVNTAILGDKFGQCKYWLLAALDTVKTADHNEVHISYVSGDQINPHITDIKKAWKSLFAISKTGKKVKLRFPLIYMTKRDLVETLKSTQNEKIMEIISFCERPVKKKKKYEKCNTCTSCLRMNQIG